MKISNRGFNLIELIIVIVVIAVLAAVSMNTKGNLSQIRLEQAINKIKSDIRYAQTLATTLQKRTGVLFRATQDDYLVYIEQSPGSWSLATDPLKKANFQVYLNTGDYSGVDLTIVYFNAYNQALVFDKWGNPYGYNVGTGVATALVNPAGVRLSIESDTVDVRVERGTGRVYSQ